MADNEIRLNVTAVESEPLNVCVKQVPMNPVNVENTYKGIDYNLLKNKPSIDGVTLEGDKTTAEVIGFDKEYVDEAILTTNAKIDSVEKDLSDRIDAVSTDNFYTKQEVDNKVIVIEADIDANADAIQKTRSDFMDSDSELQQQINAHANEITTVKQDLGDLGEQVANIESKIPEGTSDTNPLINKQQLLDEEMDIREDLNEGLSELQTQITAQASAIAGKQDKLTAGEGVTIEGNIISATGGGGGGGSVPDNVYTQDNLIAGNNVTFTEVPPEGGIDEHTIDVFHFEEDSFSGDLLGELGNVKLSLSYGSYSSITNGKFGKGLTGSGNNSSFSFNFVNGDLNLATPYTLDFWIKPNYSRDYVRLASNIYNWELVLRNNKLALNLAYSGIPEKTSEETLENNVWSHMALTTDGTTFITVYLNGKPCIHQEGGLYVYDGSASGVISANAYGVVDWDEIRISDNIRYTEEFTPPTKAYTVATWPSKTAVNAIVAVPTKTSELENDSGFLTGLPDNVYTQSNLLGGKDIEIVPEPVEGGIDEYTLGVFHYDDASNPAKNSVEGGAEYGYSKNLNTTYYKFGVASSTGGAGLLTSLSENGDWTVDAWYYCTSKYGAISQGVATRATENAIASSNTLSSHLDINDSDTSQATVHIYQKTGSVKSVVIPFKMNSWFHLATERYGNTITVYKDGVPVLSYTSDDITNGGTRYLRSYGNNYDYEDELRLSKIARYKGQPFTPPTEAYRVAEPTGNYQINFTGKSGGAFDFQGTEAEFNAAVEAGKITDNTVSLVTDDNSGELMATKAELSAVDRSKADTALSNVLANIDYVVESKFPTADDPTWYRVYKSGWVEQGGQYRTDTTQRATWGVITFFKPFINTNYTVQAVPHSLYRETARPVYVGMASIGNKTETKVDVGCYGVSDADKNNGFDWYACGQGA